MRTGGIGFGNGGIGIVDWGCWIWTGGFWGAVLANSQTVSPDTWGRPREIWVRDKARVRFPRVRRALQLDLERESLLPRRGPRHFEAAAPSDRPPGALTCCSAAGGRVNRMPRPVTRWGHVGSGVPYRPSRRACETLHPAEPWSSAGEDLSAAHFAVPIGFGGIGTSW
jgi:hypothetical protein